MTQLSLWLVAFLTLVNTWVPSIRGITRLKLKGERKRERERRGGVCFDWIGGPNCGTHSEEEKEGGDESSLKEIRINREEREGLEACVVDACTVIICGTHFFSLLYFFVCVGTHLVCCKSPRGALFDWNCFLKDSSLSLSPKQKCFTA